MSATHCLTLLVALGDQPQLAHRVQRGTWCHLSADRRCALPSNPRSLSSCARSTDGCDGRCKFRSAVPHKASRETTLRLLILNACCSNLLKLMLCYMCYVKWRCPTHKANKLSLHVGNFLHLHMISLQDFIMVVYLWAHEIAVTTTEELVGMSRAAAIRWYSYLRDVCSNRLVTHPITVEGIIV